MHLPKYTNRFKRDVKLAEKRGRNMSKLREVIGLLLAGQPLPPVLNDHPLKGEWKTSRDVHIEPDWVLIYSIDGNIVYFERTGTHSDLFDQ
ncbi:toxin of the YafQ-DinJ toxin-antitoxin system [Crenothrix polyspora]|uniref:Toxin of the YafQ-DinJ toxin-antitoxin system n=1 Tax=Crenothrix polyspora TaxID=360316 RepID=A0A1R4H782_9GAMM|nr:type II toxin-antitoxin system YafQ family toxin [Crenothrix polyspora]SJM92135.1 toxin of the YafQ-DinJ toxin-antitoxin system [Crenothrix polyspora]